jgi:phytol kinase
VTWPPDPLIGIALVAALLSLAVGVAALARRLGLVSGEVARKSVHIQLGFIIAGFPWLFTERWPVWCLAGVSVIALAGVRWLPWLRTNVGGSLHDVDRTSWGEFCFPIAAAVAWSLVPGDWIRFSLPILVLAVSDAVAALVGTWYGRIRFTTAGGRKSWEGSLAFAAATFLVVHVPLLLGTPIGRAESLLIAVNMALLLMLVEALAWEGFDNLFIPIAGVLLIDECYGMPLPGLIEGTVVMAGLALGAWWWRRHTTLDDAAVLACAVLGYVVWAAGGWLWLVAPTVLFVLYTALFPPRDGEREHRALIPFSVALPGLVWLLVDTRDHGDPRWVLAAAGTYAIHLAAIGLLCEVHRNPQRSWIAVLLSTWLMSVVIVLAPTAFIIGQSALWPAVAIAGGVLLGLLLLWVLLPNRRALPTGERRWWWQCVAALIGSGVVLVVRA